MAELNVSRTTIKEFFSKMQNKKFIIPAFQRPYSWGEEKCETLWEDIVKFHGDFANTSEEYFLGTIVSVKNEDKNIEIIDGQQRVTSLFLLLRAFYKKLEDMNPKGDEVNGLMSLISPCIWDINPVTQKIQDIQKIHIESLVATDEDTNKLHEILANGKSFTGTETDLKKQNIYMRNYTFFYKKCGKYAEDNPLEWYNLCITLLHRCIILPIECNSQDTALTIFSTLNDRGLPLSDSDIFKAQIYQIKKTPEEKSAFTADWKELTQITKHAGITLDDIFRYYSHIIRAASNDRSKEVGLRKFYAEDQYKKLQNLHTIDKLKDENLMLMSDLLALAKFWRDVHIHKSEDSKIFVYKISIEARQYLHCLSCYPNEFWRYIVSVFFHKNKDEANFENLLAAFLKELTAFLFVKFIEKPTVNAIKDDIYIRCIAVYKNEPLNFAIKVSSDFKEKIQETSSDKISRALILLHAYLIQQRHKEMILIDKSFDVEHIFPKKWQNTNYFGWENADAQVYLELYGNKVAIERKINIQAGNTYFGQKKAKYKDSKIKNILLLSSLSQQDWGKIEIENREQKFLTDILAFFEAVLIKNEAQNE